jgi:hypothetical protein
MFLLIRHPLHLMVYAISQQSVFGPVVNHFIDHLIELWVLLSTANLSSASMAVATLLACLYLPKVVISS